VRFDAMLRAAADLGAGKLATGHYARIAEDDLGPLLRAATDSNKDQTYMLARLRPDELARLWFPLGELEKPAVRELARAARLPVADRPESQDLCFLAGTRRELFLSRHGGRARGDTQVGRERPGAIVDESGTVLGIHGGHERFTIGQRRGIGVAAPEPLYVLRKDSARNRVVVGSRSALATSRVALGSAHLHRPAAAVDRVKLRYRSSPVPCHVEQAVPAGGHERLSLALHRPVDGVAPGQTACLMCGDAVIGSATIEEWTFVSEWQPDDRVVTGDEVLATEGSAEGC
jgi:tRNA-specific 2-thiouridylase